MQVVVGPVPSESVLAFVAYAGDVLDDPSIDVPPDVRSGFGVYLGLWEQLAEDGPVLLWEEEVPRDVAEYLVHAFYRVTLVLDARADRLGPAGPPEAEPFYRALVDGLLAAMSGADASAAEFADHLRAFWPRPPEDTDQ